MLLVPCRSNRAALLAALALFLASLAPAGAEESGNLLAGGSGDAGYCTPDSAAATTVPGWVVIEGSPAILCSSVAPFVTPDSAAPSPGLIAGGPYGASSLRQSVDVGTASPAIDGGGVSFALSGWLGGWADSPAQAVVTATFLDGAGGTLGAPVRLDGVTAALRQGQTALVARQVAGTLPRGTRRVAVELRFTDAKGGLVTGYADHLALTIAAPIAAAGLVPPQSTVPAFDHVFLVMMENTDFAQVTGDAKHAPFVNGLLARGTLLAKYNAVYHPSDENYLAIAAGATLVQGGVYFPKMHLTERNIGDEIEAKHKNWRAYEQGMGRPCNTTTRYDKYFEPDDAPFINFVSIAGDKARCRAHLVDTSQLGRDLSSAATTPNFAWLAADDYDDGEASGNGSPHSLRVQDRWLKATLMPIFASKAWTEERSLLILTWDESHATADNHIATILVGSHGLVREGAVSEEAYDHYSTARTIEAALGLDPLTANDKYAQPINDAFAAAAGR